VLTAWEDCTVTSGILSEAYERLHRTGPEWGGDEEGNNSLTNHGPMVAEVLVRRGHESDVRSWVDAYVPRLEELPRAGDPITDQDWQSALGNGRRIGDWTAYFTRQVSGRHCGHQPTMPRCTRTAETAMRSRQRCTPVHSSSPRGRGGAAASPTMPPWGRPGPAPGPGTSAHSGTYRK
jgi:hypothetical protein